MYEKLKVGTVVEFKEYDKQYVFVGYESPFILIFYLYSPDMLKSFDLDKQERLLLGFEKEYPYKAIDSNTHTAAAIRLMPIN